MTERDREAEAILTIHSLQLGFLASAPRVECGVEVALGIGPVRDVHHAPGTLDALLLGDLGEPIECFGGHRWPDGPAAERGRERPVKFEGKPGSAPRPVGSHLVLDEEGNFEGSVSGGCVEGAVVGEALDVIGSGQPRMLEFGVADETAWRVGLSCGGRIRVYLERVD